MNEICLVIVFNHRFDENIPKLRMIYEERFPVIRFLVPFYDGADRDVIPVYESSYQFQGYFIQAYDRLMDTNAKSFFVIGDDLIIAPWINSSNIIDILDMRDKDFFTHCINKFNTKGVFRWQPHARFSSKPFYSKACSWRSELPEYHDAVKRFESFFNEPYNEKYEEDFFDIEESPSNHEIFKQDFIRNNNGSYDIPYPLAYGYSDILIINQRKMYEFSRLCGIFAAMNLFVEIAIPTSIVLSSERKTVKTINDTSYEGRFDSDDRKCTGGILNKFNGDFSKLYSSWDKELLYIHPIKLSKWEV